MLLQKDVENKKGGKIPEKSHNNVEELHQTSKKTQDWKKSIMYFSFVQGYVKKYSSMQDAVYVGFSYEGH